MKGFCSCRALLQRSIQRKGCFKMFQTLSMYKKWWFTWKTLPVFDWVRAAACYKDGRYEDAQNFYERGLKRHPRHPARFCARLDLAFCKFKLRDFIDSERHLRQVMTELPRCKEAYLRLARLYVWTGDYLEAAWVLRHLMHHEKNDPNIAADFCMYVIENGGPAYLLQEALELFSKAQSLHPDCHKLEVVRACLALSDGDKDEGLERLKRLVDLPGAPLEGYIYLGQAFLCQGQIALARKYLRQALRVSPEQPRILLLFAQTYLYPGAFFNPEYAIQLATTAAQNTNWRCPRALHALAEAYNSQEDKMTALIMANKAKDVGEKRLGRYPESSVLDKLIESLAGAIS